MTKSLSHEDRGTGEPIVLLHAGGLDRRMFTEQLNASPDHRLVVPDLRRFGSSPTPAEPFRHDQDIVRLLDALGIEKALLAGISMGAQTAVDTALENPDRVAGLVISGGGLPDWTDPWIIDINRRLTEAEQAMSPETWVATLLEVIPGPYRSMSHVPAELVAAQREMVRHALAQYITPPIMQGRMPIVTNQLPNARERLSESKAPALVIHGALDSPDHLRFAERAANGRVETIEDAGHYPNMEKPAEYNRLVNEFAASLVHNQLGTRDGSGRSRETVGAGGQGEAQRRRYRRRC